MILVSVQISRSYLLSRSRGKTEPHFVGRVIKNARGVLYKEWQSFDRSYKFL